MKFSAEYPHGAPIQDTIENDYILSAWCGNCRRMSEVDARILAARFGGATGVYHPRVMAAVRCKGCGSSAESWQIEVRNSGRSQLAK